MLINIACFNAAAQRTVSGKITDDFGESLPGVNVFVKGTTTGTQTDLDGNFRLSVEEGVTLVFSYIGFETLEMDIGARTTINVSLNEDSELLQEVVVIGYGEQTKKVATGSISKINAENLENFSVPNVGQSLQGQVSGVIFKASSGQPGAVPQIFIRGIGTNGDNNPLVIVDGLIYDNPEILQQLSPDDVENVNILKDGASTSIYGTRGANGVIIVSTKKAKEGQGSLTYSNTFGIQSAWKTPNVLNRDQYIELITEKYENAATEVPDAIANPSLFDTDWFGLLFENTRLSTHNLSFAKGTQAGRFRASFSYVDQEGIIAPEKAKFERITARINADQEINDFLTFGQNIFYAQTSGSTIPENNEFGTPIADALVYDPLTPDIDLNTQFEFGQSDLVQKEYINPLSRIFITNNEYLNRQIAGNAWLAMEFIPDLTVKTDMAVQVSNNSNNGFSPAYELTPAFENEINDVFSFREEFTRWKWENTINYQKKINDHQFDVLLGISAQEDDYKNLGGSSSGIQPEVEFDPNFQYLDGAIDSLDLTNGTEGVRYALYSQFGRILYNYRAKYLATFTLRRDGSTRFGSANRYATFPSASVGWVVSAEPFWSISAISFLKLRASYGENGNDRIGDNLFRSTINSVYDYQFGKPNNQFIYRGSTTPVSANPEVKWERSRQFDIGFELGLWDDKISLEFDYYKKVTSDLLFIDPAAPLFLGTEAPITNLGEFQNSGFEVDINYNENLGDIKLNAGLNLTTLKNEATNLNGQSAFVDLYSWPVRNVPITRYEIRQPVGFFRGYKTDGIFRSENDILRHVNEDRELLQPDAEPGDIKYVDVNGDGQINSDDITKIGKPWADLTVGFRLGVGYKNFNLTTVWFASFGSEIYRAYERQDVPNNNQQVEWLDRWSENNPDGSYPRLVLNDPNNNSRPSDFFVENGNFLRLRNIQIAYNLPVKIIEKVKMSAAKVFIAADNLLTITDYTGFDPEVGGTPSDENPNAIGLTGVDRGFYPLTKTISAGISITF